MEGVAVDIISLPGADPYSSPKSMSPTKQANGLMKLVSKFPEPLFELAEIGYNFVAGWRILKYLKANPDVTFIYERYALFMCVATVIGKIKKLPVILEVNDSAVVDRVRPLFMKGIATAIERWCFRNASGFQVACLQHGFSQAGN